MSDKKRPLETERICALYSRGPHFVRLLKRLRAEYPGETIIAAVPEDYTWAGLDALADEILRLPAQDEGSVLHRACRLIRALRRNRCSHLVVMFDSPRLNLIARCSGAPVHWCFSADGRMTRLNSSLPRLLLATAGARMRGEWHWLRARLGTARRHREGD